MLNTYNISWPDGLKEAHRLYSRAYYKRQCLEAAITRVDPSEFEATMDALEIATGDLQVYAAKAQALYRKWLDATNEK